jgi:hypothetical protein
MREKKILQAAKLLLIAVKNGDVTIFPGESNTDYIQILEDAVNEYKPDEYINSPIGKEPLK